MTQLINKKFIEIESKDLTLSWVKARQDKRSSETILAMRARWDAARKVPVESTADNVEKTESLYDAPVSRRYQTLSSASEEHADASNGAANREQPCYNIAIVGISGVGKSSLLNYLYPAANAKTGIGKPVTENGFHECKFEMKGTQVCVYDSWGLEAGKEDQWLQELEIELSKRGIEKPASDWFHSIFYCISASEARIQPSDIRIIKKFIDNKYPINIILTKSDGISSEYRLEFVKAIYEVFPDVKVIPVCSEAKMTRAGETKQFGKNDVEGQALSDFLDAIILRVPEKIKYVIGEKLLLWAEDQLNSANLKVGIFSSFSAHDKEKSIANSNVELKKIIAEMNESIGLELKDIFSVYKNNASFIGADIISKNHSIFERIENPEGSNIGSVYSSATWDLYLENVAYKLPEALDKTIEVLAVTIDGISNIPKALVQTYKSSGDTGKDNLKNVENHIRELFSAMQVLVIEKANEIESNLKSLKLDFTQSQNIANVETVSMI